MLHLPQHCQETPHVSILLQAGLRKLSAQVDRGLPPVMSPLQEGAATDQFCRLRTFRQRDKTPDEHNGLERADKREMQVAQDRNAVLLRIMQVSHLFGLRHVRRQGTFV